ncbi:MAG: superfamily II DNA/RNA helicase [Gallionellaceae bacterium]|nr:MAG: superfamily II DNA/RNA helicase [Gallionellaceae bacterium]
MTAVLVQHKNEVLRCDMADTARLSKLLKLFFSFERPEIAGFRAAVEQFKTDLPAVLDSLRQMIEREHQANPGFRKAEQKFLAHAQEAINPNLADADVREMLIQHILTEEIFAKVFDDSNFHQHNNVARELYALEGEFFTGNLKKQTLKGLETYYAAIRATAAQISSHGEKQAFLKVIYENFYKVYNTKAADRLGVVYTPNEIVRFMIDGADWLTEKHFGKNLIDRDVEILDPATGTGTFICELLEHFRGQPAKLGYKYLNELHANEVAILPYYVANLNIEATYAAITGQYEEFPSLCFVDTLDNVGLHTAAKGATADIFGSVSEENVARIKRQNSKRISVIIGNPPYNANQANENDNNKNREYPAIDKRIKDTYIHASTAQKTKLYDMYARFFRWASDRLNENGVLAFVTNRSFIESRTFDGFRKTVAQEFSDIYVVDLGGDVRANPKLSGTKHNVFGIQTGVAISFFIKKSKKTVRPEPVEGQRSKSVHASTSSARTGVARVYYLRRPEMETAEEKLGFLANHTMSSLSFDEVQPDRAHNWVNLTSNDFDTLLPLASKETKAAKTAAKERAIFKLFSSGVLTGRDDWLYDFDKNSIAARMHYFSSEYEKWRASGEFGGTIIKWSRNLKRRLEQDRAEAFDINRIKPTIYRPFVKLNFYHSELFVDEIGQAEQIFGLSAANRAICISFGPRLSFSSLASDSAPSYSLYTADPCQYFPLKRLGSDGGSYDNITDWALKQFRQHYGTPVTPAQAGVQTIQKPPKGQKAKPLDSGLRRNDGTITKEAIFHYCYAVLHDPLYREKYALNLKREFPRIPFYADFWQWAAWGEALVKLHIGYEAVGPFPLKRTDIPDEKARAAGIPSPQSSPASGRGGEREKQSSILAPKALLRADKDAGGIALDSETTLCGIPPEAWNYKLGNRCALEWVLDQYKEKKPKDPTIREKFDTYRFADYKEKVIELLMRVTAVSIETERITQAMKAAAR